MLRLPSRDLWLLTVVLLALAACSPIRSGLNIGPGEEFVLGGNQAGSYAVDLTNIGPVTVGVMSQKRGGERTDLGLVSPGKTLSARFGPREAAVLTNSGAVVARVLAVVRADTELSMRYDVLEEPPAYEPRRLDPDEAREDVRILRSAIEEIHPGYTRYVSAEAMDALFDAIERGVAGGTTDTRLYLEASRILACLRCDHTKAELPEPIESFRKTTPSYLPFSFRLFDGRMFIDHVDDGQPRLSRGDEVLSINGLPVGRVIADVEPLVSVDGWTDATRHVEMEYSSEYLGDAIDHFWPFMYGWPGSWSIGIRDVATAATRQVQMDPLTYDAWLGMATGDAGRYINFPEAVEFRMLDDATGLLSIGTFVNYRQPVPPESVFDPVFDQLRESGAGRLIIDLRLCGGGSDDVPTTLTSYLSETLMPGAMRPPWVRTFRFGKLREHLSTWDEGMFEMPAEMFSDLGNGYFELRQPVGESRPAPARPNRFEGELIVLSSAANASGSTILLALLQEHYGATIIGERTGGSAEGPTAGVIFFLTLPNSGIKVRVPVLRSWVNVSDPAPGLGVIPDVEVRPTAESWRAGEDPVLEAASGWRRARDE